MRVTVRLFARLRDLAGTSELAADVAPGATIADVWAGVVDRHPALAPYAGSLSAARNLEYTRLYGGGGRRRRNRVHAAGVGRLRRAQTRLDRCSTNSRPSRPATRS